MKRVDDASEKYTVAKIFNVMPECWNMGLKDYAVASKMMEYNQNWNSINSEVGMKSLTSD